jgi:deoxyribodipyrimidine photo-lyase
VAWLHLDCLNAQWYRPDDRAVYVFDESQIAAAGWGIKRLTFLYETLLELGVEIYKGPVVETIGGWGQPVVTVDTPDPWLRARMGELRERVAVEVVAAPVFVELSGKVDLQRFSRYWRRAEGKLLG